MFVLENGDKIRGDASAATVVDYTLHGLDNGALKQLADGQLASGIGDIYTADSTDVVSAITLVNTDSAARTVNLYLTPSGGTARRIIPKDLSLGIGYSLYADGTKVTVLAPTGAISYTVTPTDHGDLAGLGDDDHTDYVLADGTRAMGELILTPKSSSASSTEGTMFYDSDDNSIWVATE